MIEQPIQWNLSVLWHNRSQTANSTPSRPFVFDFVSYFGILFPRNVRLGQCYKYSIQTTLLGVIRCQKLLPHSNILMSNSCIYFILLSSSYEFGSIRFFFFFFSLSAQHENRFGIHIFGAGFVWFDRIDYMKRDFFFRRLNRRLQCVSF